MVTASYLNSNCDHWRHANQVEVKTPWVRIESAAQALMQSRLKTGGTQDLKDGAFNIARVAPGPTAIFWEGRMEDEQDLKILHHNDWPDSLRQEYTVVSPQRYNEILDSIWGEGPNLELEWYRSPVGYILVTREQRELYEKLLLEKAASFDPRP